MQTGDYAIRMEDKLIASNIDTWLVDSEVTPKPIMPLVDYPNHYWAQLIECAPYWTPKERLTVASMLMGQPLEVQGATDCVFYLPDNVDAGHEVNWTSELVHIEIAGLQIADTDRPAREAWARFINNTKLKAGEGKVPINEIKKSWVEMYVFLFELSRNGVFADLNVSSASIANRVFQGLKIADQELVNKAREVMRKAENESD